MENGVDQDVIVDGVKNVRINSSEADADSGVDESTQNGSPTKSASGTGSGGVSRIPKKTPPTTPNRGREFEQRSSAKRPPVRSRSVPKPFTSYGLTPVSVDDSLSPIKKVPMNRIKVGMTASPNLKKVQSKVGSLANAKHKPGGGELKIKSQKLEWRAEPKTKALNHGYVPQGGDKRIENRKLEWNTTSRVGSLENSRHKAGGGDKKIATQRLEWKAQPKVGSVDNIRHKPGGGDIQIENRKIQFNAQSKVGSLDNAKHRPGGGDKKVFNDVEYLKMMNETPGAQLMVRSSSEAPSANSSRRESAVQSKSKTPSPKTSVNNNNYNEKPQVPLSLDFLRSAPKSTEESGKSTPESGSYKYQMRRRLSPMTNGIF